MARPLTPKQAERQRRRARQRRTLVLRAAAGVAVVAGLWVGWAMLVGSQAFEIGKVEIVGVSRLSEAHVLELISLPAEATLLRVDEDAVVRSLMEDPWVASVEVQRRFPSTLAITIEERVAMALVDTGTTFWFVDGDARVLTESVPDTATVLPVVRGVSDFVATPGQRSDSDTLRNALGVLRGITGDWAATVRVVNAPTVNETALLTAGNVEIMVGEAVRLEEKSMLIEDILRERGDDVVFIDVRSVERPVSRGLGQ